MNSKAGVMAGRKTADTDTRAGAGARSIEQRAVADLIPYANNARTHRWC